MSSEILLANACARVGILPGRGAAMSRYEYVCGDAKRAILTCHEGRANLVMAPWQNRISNGGFYFEGRWIGVDRTVAGDALPIHGTAWLLPWTIAVRADDELLLKIEADKQPYRYSAEMSYRLADDGSLGTVLSVTNLGHRLPFGLGFHPYFTRTPDVRIHAGARTITLQDSLYLPTEQVAITTRPDLDFTTPHGLPPGPINNEFGGWDGFAEITWPAWGVACRLETADASRYVLYSPGADASFFCLEPVTHSIDAFNRAEPQTEGGLVVLARGETLTLGTTFRPRRL